jgi:Mg-chelatase subunit ChlD
VVVSEQGHRRALYSELLRVRHRDVDPILASLAQEMEADPDWAGRLCTYLCLPGSGVKNRDLQECAIATLLGSYPDYRECGQALLLGHPTYATEPTVSGLEPFRIFRVFKHMGNGSPRRMRGIWVDYLKALSKDHKRLDGVVLRNRSAMRGMWRKYHTSPRQFPRVSDLLFGSPPSDSKLYTLKVIAQMSDPVDRARELARHKFPLVTFTSLVGEWTPPTIAAAIMVMSPQEALNARKWVEKTGLLSDPEVRDLYQSKIKGATKSAATIRGRKSAKGSDAQVEAVLKEVEQKAVDKDAPIKGVVGLAIDKSGSMATCIEFGKAIAVRIAARCVDGLYVSVFDSHAREVVLPGTRVDEVELAFSRIISGGMTSISRGVQLLHEKHNPDRYVIVTDEGENRGPTLAEYFAQNADLSDKQFVFVSIADLAWRGTMSDLASTRLERAGANVTRFEAGSEDFYILDQVASAMAGEPIKSIIDLILETELVRIVR